MIDHAKFADEAKKLVEGMEEMLRKQNIKLPQIPEELNELYDSKIVTYPPGFCGAGFTVTSSSPSTAAQLQSSTSTPVKSSSRSSSVFTPSHAKLPPSVAAFFGTPASSSSSSFATVVPFSPPETITNNQKEEWKQSTQTQNDEARIQMKRVAETTELEGGNKRIRV